jgi:formate/nitrite transporter FocA (FNT family)
MNIFAILCSKPLATNIATAADHKMHHTFIEAVALGILANLMVCLAVWMSYSGRFAGH